MVFQEPMSALNPTFTVGSMISDVLRTNLGMSKAEAKERTIELLTMFVVPTLYCLKEEIRLRRTLKAAPEAGR